MIVIGLAESKVRNLSPRSVRIVVHFKKTKSSSVWQDLSLRNAFCIYNFFACLTHYQILYNYCETYFRDKVTAIIIPAAPNPAPIIPTIYALSAASLES
jgi:hypothetical protein